MAISRVQSKAGDSGAVAVLTMNLVMDAAPTNGNILVAAVCVFGTSQVRGAGASFLSQSGVTWMFAPGLSGQGNTQCNVMLALGRVFASASDTITLDYNTVGGTSGGAAIVVAEYSGASTIFDQYAAATATSTSAASGATGTTATANQLWVGAIGARGTNGVTFSSPTNGFSIVGQDNSTINASSDRSVALLEKIVSGTGTANAGATVSSSQIWVAEVLTLQEAPAAGGSGASYTFG